MGVIDDTILYIVLGARRNLTVIRRAAVRDGPHQQRIDLKCIVLCDLCRLKCCQFGLSASFQLSGSTYSFLRRK